MDIYATHGGCARRQGNRELLKPIKQHLSDLMLDKWNYPD